MKKNAFTYLFFALFFVFAGLTLGSCSKKTGCKINETAHIQPNKKGKYKRSKTKSGLFPKDMRRRGR